MKKTDEKNMKWLEIIKVQVAGISGIEIDPELLKHLTEGMQAPGLKKARIYAHALVKNELVITLKWTAVPQKLWGSDLAHSLTRELRRNGLVDHSVWIESMKI